MAVEDATVVTVNPQMLDEDGYIKLWDLASQGPGGTKRTEEETRLIASKLLGFLCKQRYEYILLTTHAAEYLQDRFDRDPSILNNWTPDTDNVDILCQHIEVPAEITVRFLRDKRFKPEGNYNPRRSTRLEWFNEDWKIG